MLAFLKVTIAVVALALIVPASVFVISGGSRRQAMEALKGYAIVMAVLYLPGALLFLLALPMLSL